MLSSLMKLMNRGQTALQGAPSEQRFRAPVLPDELLFVIGDIHGRDDLLARMLDRLSGIRERHHAGGGRLVFVGDYIDRGDRSAQVLDRLSGLCAKAGSGVVCLAGNHERMMLDFLADPEAKGPRWLRNGGLQTLASFGIGQLSDSSTGAALVAARDRLRTALPAGMEAWLAALPCQFQSGNVAVVHAAADPGQPLGDQSMKTLLWGHDRFLTEARTDGLWVVHGHHIVEAPSVTRGRIAIDTGAFATHRLTAAVLSPVGTVRFLEA